MVQVIPREFEKKHNWAKLILPWMSLLLTILVIIGVFFLSSKIKAKNTEFEELESELEAMETKQVKEDEAELKAYKKKVINVVEILGERKLSLPFYNFLESFVHPKVYFTSASLDMKNGEAKLLGVAEDFKTLGEQVKAFSESGFTISAKVQNVSLTEEGIDFGIDLNFFEPEKEKK